MSRLWMFAIATVFILSGCLSKQELNDSLERAVKSATAKPLDEADEGSMGPLQDAHEGEIVFSNAAIARSSSDASALISETSLGAPLFIRAYLPKTPARLFFEQEHDCYDTQVMTFVARLKDSKLDYDLHMGGISKIFRSMRSASLSGADSEQLISILPNETFVFDTPKTKTVTAMTSVISQMTPGKNTVEVELVLSCHARGNKGTVRLSAAKGSVVIDVSEAQLSAMAKLVTYTAGSERDMARIKPNFQQVMAADSELVLFIADTSRLISEVQKETQVRVVMRNADAICRYQTMTWIEPYLGGGMYDAGYILIHSKSRELDVPCP